MLGGTVDIDGNADDEFGQMEVDDEGEAVLPRQVRRQQILLNRRSRKARAATAWWSAAHGFDSRTGQLLYQPDNVLHSSSSATGTVGGGWYKKVLEASSTPSGPVTELPTPELATAPPPPSAHPYDPVDNYPQPPIDDYSRLNANIKAGKHLPKTPIPFL